jgi:peptidoglycan glycosyltransferase
MFNLDQRGALISASLGLIVGLIVAWRLWYEAPPPREIQRAEVRPPPSAVRVSGVQRAPESAVEATVEATVEPAAPVEPGAVMPSSQPAAVPVELPAALLDPTSARVVKGKMIQDLGKGRRVEYTLIPEIQSRAQEILEKAEVPFGALVAMEPHTGRVLGYAQHAALRPDIEHLPTLANPPAASVFKVVTAAALLEEAQVSPNLETCYHGGSRGVVLKHLEDNEKADTACRTLSVALGQSTNVIFAKLADRKLSPAILERYATAFGWNQKLPFVFPIQTSTAKFSDDRLTFARTAAGFYNTQLSPMHGAMLASAVANKGLMVAPKLVERYLDGEDVLVEREVTLLRRAVRERTARQLAEMMVNTTENGTAGPYFRKRARSLSGIKVAGKTGTLSAKTEDGTRHRFSWWVGFAPADNPQIAVAALVVNVGNWRIKSSYLAREVLETFFERQQR